MPVGLHWFARATATAMGMFTNVGTYIFHFDVNFHLVVCISICISAMNEFPVVPSPPHKGASSFMATAVQVE